MSSMMAHAYQVLSDALAHVEQVTAGAFPIQRRMMAGKIDSTLLQALSENKHRAAIMNSIAQARIANIRSTTRETRDIDPQALRQKAAEVLLWSLVVTRTRSIPAQIPLQHHWLPLCYTKAFSIRNRKNRGVMVGQSFFNEAGKVSKERLVPDVFFAHEKTDTGYYHAHTEKFFSHIEGYYASERPDSQDSWSDWSSIVMFAFFAVQSARNPEPTRTHATARFHKDHQSHIMQDMFDALDTFEAPHVSYVFNGLEFMFSPFFPPRVRILADGTRVNVYPISPERAFIVSSRPLSTDEANEIAARNNVAMVKHAIRTGQPLYGLLGATAQG